MIEQSTLTHETLVRELKQRYGFSKITNIDRILNASANIFKVKCDNEYYILKEYQSSYTLDEIKKEEKIIALFQHNQIPTTELVLTKRGEYAWKYEDHIFVLQKFIEGTPGESFKGTIEQIKESAFYLSKIVLSLKEIQLDRQDYIIDWIGSESINKIEQKYDILIKECDNHSEQIYKKIKEEALLRKKLLQNFISNKSVLNSIINLTHLNSHGDYSVLQFIYKNERIKAIIDLSVACKLPIIWEIIRSYSYIDPECKNGIINIKNLIEYVREFMKNVPLSTTDLAMMPYVYLIQLLKSLYGYDEYVFNKSENKEQLIEFAFWRTKMCKYLAENAEKLSMELVKLK